MIQTVYDSGAQTLARVDISTHTTNSGADAGSIRFHCDDAGEKLRIDDGGIIVYGSIETADLVLSNANQEANDFDGTKGSWQIQEGSDDLFIMNKLTGKKYKFKLEEI